MKKDDLKLVCIENDREIHWKKDSQFLCQLQQALLLALHERGRINRIQLKQAEISLQKQHRECLVAVRRENSI